MAFWREKLSRELPKIAPKSRKNKRMRTAVRNGKPYPMDTARIGKPRPPAEAENKAVPMAARIAAKEVKRLKHDGPPRALY